MLRFLGRLPFGKITTLHGILWRGAYWERITPYSDIIQKAKNWHTSELRTTPTGAYSQQSLEYVEGESNQG